MYLIITLLYKSLTICLNMDANDSKIPNFPSIIWNSHGHFSNRRFKVDPGNLLLPLVGLRAPL